MQYYDLRFQLKHSVTDAEAMDYGEQGYFFDSTDGVPFVSVDIAGDIATGRALYEAHRKLTADGIGIVRAIPDFVTIRTMANRFNVSRQAAQRWSKDGGFPLPVITDGTSLWYWPDVRSWVQLERGKETFDDSLYPSFDEYTLFNASLLGADASSHTLLENWSKSLYENLLGRHPNSNSSALVAWNIGQSIKHINVRTGGLNVSRFEPNFEADLEEGGRFRARDQRV